jgi:hypothetical protein
MDEVFYDPNFQAQVFQMVNSAPKPDNAKPSQWGGGMGAIQQNGQPGHVMAGTNDMRMPMGGAGGSDMASEAQPAEVGTE